MESEADLGDGLLSSTIGCRRRSASVSDDYSVQKTNDDATESKYAAIQLKYWEDPFIDHFIHGCNDMPHRRDPEISRGYWARTAAVFSIVEQFVEKVGPSAQIVSLGAGFDTLYWRLKQKGCNFGRYIEVDFASVTAKKIRLLRNPHKTPDLASFFSEKLAESHHTDLHAGDYHIVASDLRQLKELETKLFTTGLNKAEPLLVIAECVFVYMTVAQSTELLKFFTSNFQNVSVINYEQVNMTDKFSQIMTNNLNSRGIVLPGITACENLETQKQRFLDSGFDYVHVWTMDKIYREFLDKIEVARIEKIEFLDEKELLSQLLDHYCIVNAVKEANSKLDFKNITPK
uniref:Leucine carboxyl methyltransferase 1 n=1 Tax=Acrobeloides nanus TaxID=290746 RepID=A0A914CK12_9BILA